MTPSIDVGVHSMVYLFEIDNTNTKKKYVQMMTERKKDSSYCTALRMGFDRNSSSRVPRDLPLIMTLSRKSAESYLKPQYSGS
jgi:hypothetical protein